MYEKVTARMTKLVAASGDLSNVGGGGARHVYSKWPDLSPQ